MAGPSLLLLNARVHTMDPGRPAAGAVAVSGDRVIAVGDDLRDLARPGTRVIDCEGCAVLPGFHDGHLHLLATAARLSAVDCSRARSIAEIQALVRARAAALPQGGWVRAAGYDETLLAERRHPDRWDLDLAAPGHPVRLQHRSYHACVVNSPALLLAGIGAGTKEPPGGVIDRDLATGEPSGLLLETAQELVRAALPPPGDEEIRRGVWEVSCHLLRLGVTALQDATASNGLQQWEFFGRLQRDGLLRQRATLMLGVEGARVLPQGGGRDQDRLRLGATKIVLDESTGRLHPPPGELRDAIGRAHRAGRQVALHVVTAGALDAALDALEAVQAAYPRPAARHRIEHCSVCRPQQAARLARLGVRVCTQPAFIHHSGERYRAEVGPEDAPWLYPLRTLLDAGVSLAGGSDSPIAPPDPFVAMHAGVTRLSAGGATVAPSQGVTPGEVLVMYTRAAAEACFWEGDLGRIAPGYLADLLVLSEDPLAVAPDRLLSLAPRATIVGGEVAWDNWH